MEKEFNETSLPNLDLFNLNESRIKQTINNNLSFKSDSVIYCYFSWHQSFSANFWIILNQMFAL